MKTDAEEFDSLIGSAPAKDSGEWKTVDTTIKNSDAWKPEKGELLVGVYVGNHPVTTKFGDTTVFTMEKPDHSRIDIWSTAQLNRAFAQIPVGTEIRITYNGKVLPEKGNAYKDFTVEMK